MNEFKRSIFLFRRDLRLEDNTGLINACNSSLNVIPCFILDPRILENNNQKISYNRLCFLKESLLDLDNELKKRKSRLHFFYGVPEKIIKPITEMLKADAVFANKDYTPFSKKRDKKIHEVCSQNRAKVIFSDDLLLRDPDQIKSLKGEPYKVFGAFYAKSKEIPIRKPQSYSLSNFTQEQTSLEIPIIKLSNYLGNSSLPTHFSGGRKSAMRILENLKNLENYDVERNYPALDKTSHLSSHNKFGTCSVREIYAKILKDLGPDHSLAREIHWRDFFTYIVHHFPYSKNNEFHLKYKKIPWSKNKKAFSKWCSGKTGFPIIDAGMRELNETGFMHNRVRMIVASFLTKDLHIDWRWGEEYFASKLIDYDSSVNVGNWQWAASTGCDAQPWFRIFNPWLQQKKFDPDCVYIKKWIPELEPISSKIIHSLETKHSEIKVNYPSPIVEHKVESQHTKEMFRKVTA